MSAARSFGVSVGQRGADLVELLACEHRADRIGKRPGLGEPLVERDLGTPSRRYPTGSWDRAGDRVQRDRAAQELVLAGAGGVDRLDRLVARAA